MEDKPKKHAGGRPKGSKSKTTIAHEIMRKRLEEKVYENYDEILEAKMDLAIGHYVYSEKVKGKVYKRSPEGKSQEYLIDQVIGKPLERAKVETKVEFDFDA